MQDTLEKQINQGITHSKIKPTNENTCGNMFYNYDTFTNYSDNIYPKIKMVIYFTRVNNQFEIWNFKHCSVSPSN